MNNCILLPWIQDISRSYILETYFGKINMEKHRSLDNSRETCFAIIMCNFESYREEVWTQRIQSWSLERERGWLGECNIGFDSIGSLCLSFCFAQACCWDGNRIDKAMFYKTIWKPLNNIVMHIIALHFVWDETCLR